MLRCGAAIVLLLLAGPSLAQTTFSNTSGITIPASGAATPYPSNINVSGLPAIITDVNVTLGNYNHTWPGDVDVVLRAPDGTLVVLMSDTGENGADAVNLTYTFDQSASGGLSPTLTAAFV